ncbi:helix-turn-helix domain-containing protein [Roseinatronobacter sp.]|uniref:helix-turn-helix domain-containing protein n=1 Tax=Roseinatronobacter sp. TaxID=1945755 RepID=UPI003F7244D1
MRDINLKATEYFDAGARHRTVTKAALELSISRSAVSEPLGMLENQSNVTMFRREKPRLILRLDGYSLFQTTTQGPSPLRNALPALPKPIQTGTSVPKPCLTFLPLRLKPWICIWAVVWVAGRT